MQIDFHTQAKTKDAMTPIEAKRCSWKERVYPVPNPSRAAFRWKASALRGLHRWAQGSSTPEPAIIVVPALYNRLPAETVALGWLNEIDALGAIRQRMSAVAKNTGWDVFTFHTQHNLDHFYDTTISAVSDTWSHEGSLSAAAVAETKRRFGKVYDYHRIQPRLVENLVFQSTLMEWVAHHAENAPLQFQVVGTALYSALIWSGALSFESAVESALKVGSRWDSAVQSLAEGRAAKSKQGSNESEIGWQRFDLIQGVIDGKEHLSIAVEPEDLPKVGAPLRPFWFSATGHDDPILIESAYDAMRALESLNLLSWSLDHVRAAHHSVRGWLVSPLHPLARSCRWSVSNFLLATPGSVQMFMKHIAAMSLAPVMIQPDAQNRLPQQSSPAPKRMSGKMIESEVQNRLRLSRIKVTGP